MKEYKVVLIKFDEAWSRYSTKIKRREELLNKYASEGWKLAGVDRSFLYFERDVK